VAIRSSDAWLSSKAGPSLELRLPAGKALHHLVGWLCPLGQAGLSGHASRLARVGVMSLGLALVSRLRLDLMCGCLQVGWAKMVQYGAL